MDRAGRNKILPRRRARKPEEERFKNRLEEENGAKCRVPHYTVMNPVVDFRMS
jgi:hypothetical protein